MKYVVVMLQDTNCTVSEHSTLAESIKFADSVFESLDFAERSKFTSFYVLESADPDVESEMHFDGTIIKDYTMHL